MITKTLAIETSCDDTSIAVVAYDSETTKFEIEDMVSYTQTIHNSYGGVVPEIASREHANQIILVFEQLVQNFQKKTSDLDFFDSIDFISYTSEPGLPGSLVVGKMFAKTLGTIYNKKVIPIHHIHGHIFSILLDRKLSDIQFPAVVITVSGGHNSLYLINEDLTFEQLGKTLDDAGGECFDKVARMLGGPYPGGAWVGQQATKGGKSDISFSRIFLDKDLYNFSFSGMKSQVHKYLEDLKQKKRKLTSEDVCNISWEFQEAVIEVLSKKLIRAGLLHQAKTLGMVGGVSCSDRRFEYTKELLQNENRLSNQATKLIKDGFAKNTGFDVFYDQNKKIFQFKPNFYRPVKKLYSTDNAGMIGVVGLMKYIGLYKGQ